MDEIPQQDRNTIVQTLLKHDYELIGRVGKGGFASVFLVRSTKYDEKFVVKRVTFQDSPRLKDQDTDAEIESLKNLSHPLIIKMYEFFKDETALYIILEYCEGGSMIDVVEKGPIKPQQFWAYAKQILEALKACHMAHIAHRDIKPGNILLDQYNRIRLADFGLAHHMTEGAYLTKQSGSLAFMAPEVVQRSKYDPTQADIWSLGITFFYMATGELPFPLARREELVSAIVMGQIQYPLHFDKKIRSFISKMTKIVPKGRATIQGLLQEDVFLPVIAQSKTRIGIRCLGPGTRRLVSSSVSIGQKGGVSGSQSFDAAKPSTPQVMASDDEEKKVTKCNSFRLGSFRAGMHVISMHPKILSSSPVCNSTFTDDAG